MSVAPDPAGSGRRRFLKLLGFAGVSSALVPRALSWAQGASGAASIPARPDSAAGKPDQKPVPGTPPAAEKPPEISEDAKALAAIVARRYSLSDAQRDLIAKDFDNDLPAGKRLRAVKLANGDEPDFTFKA